MAKAFRNIHLKTYAHGHRVMKNDDIAFFVYPDVTWAHGSFVFTLHTWEHKRASLRLHQHQRQIHVTPRWVYVHSFHGTFTPRAFGYSWEWLHHSFGSRKNDWFHFIHIRLNVYRLIWSCYIISHTSSSYSCIAVRFHGLFIFTNPLIYLENEILWAPFVCYKYISINM